MNRRLEFYFDNKKKIHVTCNNFRFYNGVIQEINSNKKLIILLDDKLGEIPILFNEIEQIEPFMEEKEK